MSWSEMKGEVWAESCTLPTTLARWYLQSGHGRESRERRERLWTEPCGTLTFGLRRGE